MANGASRPLQLRADFGGTDGRRTKWIGKQPQRGCILQPGVSRAAARCHPGKNGRQIPEGAAIGPHVIDQNRPAPCCITSSESADRRIIRTTVIMARGSANRQPLQICVHPCPSVANPAQPKGSNHARKEYKEKAQAKYSPCPCPRRAGVHPGPTGRDEQFRMGTRQ